MNAVRAIFGLRQPRVRPSARMLALGSLCFLAGCAVTSVSLNDAKSASQLAQSLQGQIDIFTQDQQVAANRRLQWIELLQTQQAAQAANIQTGSQVMVAAGMTGRAKLAQTILDVEAAQISAAQQLQTAQAALKAQDEKILSAVPSTHDAVSKLQKDLLPLEKQRTTDEQLSFLRSYYKTTMADKASLAAAAAASATAAAASAANAAKLTNAKAIAPVVTPAHAS